MDEIIVRYTTSTGLEKSEKINTDETQINLELRDIESIDLLPIIWCRKLERLTLRHNNLAIVDLSPLNRCVYLQRLLLSHNRLENINLSPLSKCLELREIRLEHNLLHKVNISPLFHCSKLEEFAVDEGVKLTAEVYLKTIGTWPDVLVEKYGEILWLHSLKP